jgi:hypothetical protein
MPPPANFPTNFLSNVALSGGPGVTLVSVDPIFGIGHLLVAGTFIEIGDIIFQVRFIPVFGNIDQPFFLSVNSTNFTLLANFFLTDSVGGLLEVVFFDVSFQVFRTISVKIFFDFTLPVLPGSGPGSPNPGGLPGQWVVRI